MQDVTKKLLDQAAKLERDAEKLRAAVAVMNSVHHEPIPFNGTRAEQLATFIAEKGGGATRTEIVRESGIPPGTVASLLGTKKKFEKDQNDIWHIKNKELAEKVQQRDAVSAQN